MTIRDGLRAELDAISSWFIAVFRDLDAMNVDFTQVLEQASQPGDDVAKVARLARSGLKSRTERFLSEHPRVDGAGIIFHRSELRHGRGVIEWWTRDEGDAVKRCNFGVEPSGDRFYDYERFEWFTAPLRSGGHSITGPYIDYLGVDEYVVTLTAPNILRGTAIGVAGIDFQMRELERELMPPLRRVPGPAALLSPQLSVLLGNSSRFVTGDRLAVLPEGFISSPLDAGGVTVFVVHAADD